MYDMFSTSNSRIYSTYKIRTNECQFKYKTKQKSYYFPLSLSRKIRLGISVLQHCTKIAGQLFCATLAIGSVRLHPLQPPETRHPPIIICIGFLFTHTHVRTGSMLLCCSLIELAGWWDSRRCGDADAGVCGCVWCVLVAVAVNHF